MALWELSTPKMGDSTTCNYCSQVVDSWYDSEDISKAYVSLAYMPARERQSNVQASSRDAYL